jgi:cobalt-zinc-cadmium efflux system protein
LAARSALLVSAATSPVWMTCDTMRIDARAMTHTTGSHRHEPGQACDHEHEHDHAAGHGMGHGHSHAPKDFGAAFAIGTALNLGFVIIEATYGFWANSMALLADAGHNLSDVFGLLMAWGAAVLAKRTPSPRFTYGLRSSSILAALANAVFLMIAVGAIVWEALNRLGAPEPVASTTVMTVAAIGIVVNGVTAWLFASGSKGDVNIRGAFLHMAADALVSVGVVIAGAVIAVTAWLWVDPVVSLVIAALILYGTWGLLKESAGLALHGVPPGIDVNAVRTHLQGLPGVTNVHDLHIWPMSTTETALTCHLVIPAGHPGDAFLAAATDDLHDEFEIHHATLQIEHVACPGCYLDNGRTG